jgi:hypothetical protein
VGGKLLAPVLDQHVFGHHLVAGGGEPREATADQAIVGAFRFEALVAGLVRLAPARCSPRRPKLVIVGVEDVHVGSRGEPRI